ncbi:MAG: DUF1877 family protein [Myxococcota bacterium]
MTSRCAQARTSLRPSTFFLTGTAYPDGAVNTLGAALSGSRSVEAPTLENGAFYVTETAAIPDVVRALTSVDRDALRASVASADLASLVEDEELYDLELLDDAEVPDAIVSELDALLAFYVQVDTAGGAVVSYTT